MLKIHFGNDKNLSLAYNWRKALCDYSKGDWVLMLLDDDYLIDSPYITKAMKLIKIIVILYLFLQILKHIMKTCNTFKHTNIILQNVIDEE